MAKTKVISVPIAAYFDKEPRPKQITKIEDAIAEAMAGAGTSGCIYNAYTGKNREVKKAKRRRLKKPIEYYVLHMWGDVEPHLHGPFKNMKRRDVKAQKIKREDTDGGGLYWLDMKNGKPTVGTYTDEELDPTGENTA